MRALYAATLGLSAFLLFVVQPLLGAALLPLLAARPRWTTTRPFFQAALLAGYGWAHVASAKVPCASRSRRTSCCWPAGSSSSRSGRRARARPPTARGSARPVARRLARAGRRPAGRGPLGQRPAPPGVARPGRRPSGPNPLYAASNVGSFVALLGYPLVERTLGVAAQARAWAAGYGLLLASVLTCAVCGLAARPGGDGAGRRPSRPSRRRRPGAACAGSSSRPCRCALLLGVTTHLTAEVSAAPLLWVLPLAAYLLTFIVAFGRDPGDGAAASRALGVLAAPLSSWRWRSRPPRRSGWPSSSTPRSSRPSASFATARSPATGPRRSTSRPSTWCWPPAASSGSCARWRPRPSSSVLELPLAIVAACALRPADPRPEAPDAPPPRAPAWALDLGWAGLVLAVALGLERLLQAVAAGLRSDLRLLLAFAPAVVLAHSAKARPRRHALALAALFGAGLLADGSYGQVLHRERSFFGVVRVAQDAT